MESKAGSVLTLIGGILTIIVSVIFSIWLIFIIATTPRKDLALALVIFGFVVSAVFIFAGIQKIKNARRMRNPETTRRGGIGALILGIVTSDIFSIIGGILGISRGGK